jgi:uncharacterized membrane protein YfcA
MVAVSMALLDVFSTLALGARNWRLMSGGAVLRLLPFCALGGHAGHKLYARLPVDRVRQAVYAALAAGGVGVIARALAGGEITPPPPPP